MTSMRKFAENYCHCLIGHTRVQLNEHYVITLLMFVSVII